MDSVIAFEWIQHVGIESKKIVQNKVRENANLDKWRHIQDETENIADLPIRGCLPEVLRR